MTEESPVRSRISASGAPGAGVSDSGRISTSGAPGAGVSDSGRRAFLKRSIFVLGGLITAGLMAPAGTYLLSPLWKKESDEWVEIGEAAKIPAGDPTKVDFVRRKKDGWATVEERASVWVVTADGKEFVAFDPLCTHLGCPYRWDATKGQFLCPCHSAVFGIDGEVLSGPPPRPLDRYPVKVAAGKLLIQPVKQGKEG